MAAGREWFIHTIYTVRSRDNANRNKRGVEYLHHSMSYVEPPAESLTPQEARRSRRSAAAASSSLGPGEGAQDIGADKSRGTNIQHIALERADRAVVSQRQPGRDSLLLVERPRPESSGRESPLDSSTLPTLVGLAGLLLLVCLVAVVVLLLLRRKRRQRKEKSNGQSAAYSTSSSAAYSGFTPGRSAGGWSSSDSSEV